MMYKKKDEGFLRKAFLGTLPNQEKLNKKYGEFYGNMARLKSITLEFLAGAGLVTYASFGDAKRLPLVIGGPLLCDTLYRLFHNRNVFDEKKYPESLRNFKKYRGSLFLEVPYYFFKTIFKAYEETKAKREIVEEAEELLRSTKRKD